MMTRAAYKFIGNVMTGYDWAKEDEAGRRDANRDNGPCKLLLGGTHFTDTGGEAGQQEAKRDHGFTETRFGAVHPSLGGWGHGGRRGAAGDETIFGGTHLTGRLGAWKAKRGNGR